MILLTIEGSPLLFNVEFRHSRKDGPRPTLARRSPIRAITTCVIVVTQLVYIPHTFEWDSEIHFVAIANAVCSNEDAFSRREGRQLAFRKAVTECGALRNSRMALIAAYLARDPYPIKERPPALSQPEKTSRWEAGWAKRKLREYARGERSAS